MQLLLLACEFGFPTWTWIAPPTLLIIFLVFIGCFILERIVPGWKLPPVPTWTRRVLALNFLQLLVVLLAGVSWEKWFSAYSVFHLSAHVSPVVGGMVAYFVATFIFYWWHRWRHTVDFLWQHFHQIHHSPQRLEVITSFYKHPLEMTANSLLGGLLIYTLLGLSPVAGGIYTLCTALGEFFYHTNVRTPQWIGYIFQRPEMHRIHHEYQKHAHNYGDIVWWDMLFGTYCNPCEFRATCGFDAEKEEQLLPMLGFRDVHKDAQE
ncbi:sterol desaturase family protein [Hymenobacter sp. HD11105]